MSEAIAHALEDAAKKAEQGLSKDFSDAYHGILKDTEEKAGQVADNAADNEAKTVDDLTKSAERPGGEPSVGDPHPEDPGPVGGDTGDSGPGAGRDQVSDPQDAGRAENAVCDGGEPVDMATGRMFIDQTDASLPGSLPLLFTRCFESGYRAGRWMGRRWVCTFDERLEIDDQGVVHLGADRRTQAYPHPAPGQAVQASAGVRRDLTVDDAERFYTLTDRATGLDREFTVQPDGATALLTQVRDRSGRHYDLDYDRNGTPLSITHSGGYRLLVTVAYGRITELLLAGAAPDGGDQSLMRYGYTDGHLTEVYNSSGLPMRFANDAWGRITSWTDRNNSHYWYTYDDRNRVIDEGGADGSLRFQFSYGEPDPDTGLRVHTETNALGHTTTYRINDGHQVTARTDPLGRTTHYQRDEHDRLLTETDPLGRTVRFDYDAEGDLTAVTRPDGSRATAAYDAELSLPTVVVDADGAAWQQEYDAQGRRTTLTDPLGATTHYAYDAAGHLAAVADALGHTTRIRCDAAGLPVESTDPNGATVRCQRDAFGRPVTLTDALGAVTRTTWTVEGRPATRTAADGSTQSWQWDGEGNLLVHTDELGQATSYEYTHFETLAARTGPDGARITFTHDAHMQLTAVTDPLGRQWRYLYDAAGQLIGEDDFHGRSVRYQRDAAGQLTALTDPLGIRTDYRYDILGRTVAKAADGRTTSYAYDPAGRLVHAANTDAEISRAYDPLGNLLGESVNGRALNHSRDPLGRRTRRTTPTGHSTLYAYDPAGQVTTLASTGGTLDFAHDPAGRERRRTIAGTLTLTNEWDQLTRLTGQTVQAGETVLQRRAYRYRSDGNLTGTEDHLTGPRSFDLDPAGRVTAVRAADWTESYAYDPAGNLTDAQWPATPAGTLAQGSRTYTGTQLTTAGRVRYEHDAAGRVTLRQVTRLSRKPDNWHYSWNAENQLAQVTTPDGTQWRYHYDPLGRRLAKSRLAADGQTVVERTDFTWDGPTLTEQTTHASHLPGPHTITWDHQGFTPLTQTETITTPSAQDDQARIDRRFFAIVTDLVGTPTELLDPATGTIAWRATTTLWGNTTWPRDSTTYTPLRFPGQYYDPETRLHYNLNRYYDPETARYTTPDPLGLTPAPNPDTYVSNPHTWTDPLGLSPHETAGPQQAAKNPAHGYDLRGKDPMSIVPDDAEVRWLTPHSNGGAQYGVEFKWSDDDGNTVRLRAHGPDGTAPVGSHAATGDVYRVQVGKRYQDIDGNLFHPNVHNPNSPHYNPTAANNTHMPWPSEFPGL